MTTAGSIVLDARQRHGMTQEQFGGMLGYDRSMVSNMEHKRRQVPDDVLAAIPAKLRDDVAAMMICSSCTRGGFFSGIELPIRLDCHPAELMDIAQIEFCEFTVAMESYLAYIRHAEWSKADEQAVSAQKHIWDLAMIALNLTAHMNRVHGTYHREILNQVSVSVRRKVNLQKEKDRKTGPEKIANSF